MGCFRCVRLRFCAGMEFARVARERYEVVAEDRCPEPLDPAALLKENVSRHARVLAALRSNGTGCPSRTSRR